MQTLLRVIHWGKSCQCSAPPKACIAFNSDACFLLFLQSILMN